MKLSRETVNTLVALLVMVAGVGGSLVVLGAMQEVFHNIPQTLEDLMNAGSSALTIVGVLFVTASVYFPETAPEPPERFSQTRVAPLVMFLAVAALASSIWAPLSPSMVNGFAILGLVGAMFRTFTWLKMR